MGNKASVSTAPVPVDRIYVIGPSSTGKTTLCNRLAETMYLEKGPSYISEVARGVIQQRGYTRKDVHLLQMQKDIMEAQIERERETRGVHPIQLFDRSALDPIVYANLTGVDAEDSRRRMIELGTSDAFKETLEEYKKKSSFFVLLGPVKEWLVDDGVRHLDDLDRTADIFRDLLGSLKVPYIEIGEEAKDLRERVNIVLREAEIQIVL